MNYVIWKILGALSLIGSSAQAQTSTISQVESGAQTHVTSAELEELTREIPEIQAFTSHVAHKEQTEYILQYDQETEKVDISDLDGNSISVDLSELIRAQPNFSDTRGFRR